MHAGKICILPNGNLQIVDNDHGELTLAQWKITPLNIMDIQDYKANSKVNITFTDLTALEDQNIEEISIAVTIPNVLGSYSLIQGGWLPANFGMLKSIVFADRNFISKIEEKFVGDKAKTAEAAEWFADLKNFNFTIDILPYVLEGNKRRFQTKDEVIFQIEEVIRKLKIAAPGIQIVKYPKNIEDYAWNLLQYIMPFIQNRMDFLKMAAPFIKPSSNKETILKRWKLIARVAKHYNISTDIVHLLALISVSAPQNNSPGLGILKMSPNYSTEMAYNACFDISLIELFMNAQQMCPFKKYTIITGDLALTRICGLLNDIKHKGSNGVDLTFSAKIPQYIAGKDPELHNKLITLISAESLNDKSE
ncbi:MAG: hypothetical protein ACT6Q8_03705 [Niveispirillum sp.]|uniref:hypothetical protein n=1 Tax=Niveispirillum sp. TaxID=1917217 RepID=UPI004035118F